MGDSGMVVHDAHRFSPAAPDEEFVYGSCLPGWHSASDDETAVEEWLSFVRSEGIERVCCLVAGTPEEVRDSSLGRYYDAFGRSNVCHAPTAPHELVSHERLVETILPFLRESVEQESPVVVHCLSGIGRTGQVLAAWLVAAREYSPESAIEVVRETGRDPFAVVERGNSTEEELLDSLRSMRELPR
jgi:hypothetical protein